MTTLFISDLHLDCKHPELAHLFEIFLQQHARGIDALYILGDFFEIWFGDDIQNDFQKQIIQRLKTYTDSGIPTYFMVGNRDFLIGQQFANESGCILLADPSIIDLYGTATLLKHGDDLCSLDVKHQWYRRLTRNKLIQKLFLTLPRKTREDIGNGIREKSMQRVRQLDYNLLDATQEQIQAEFTKHKVTQFIHGHTHRPTIEYFQSQDKSVCRMVLSDWGKLGNYLLCEPNGTKRLVYFATET